MIMLKTLLMVVLLLCSCEVSLGFVRLPRNLTELLQRLSFTHLSTQPRRLQPEYFNQSGVFSYTEWSEFSACDKVCGGGYSSRTRQCLSADGREVTTINCAMRGSNRNNAFQALRNFLNGHDFTTEVQSASCNTQACDVAPWSDWSVCSRPCGGGIQYASRSCLSHADETKCNFQRRKGRRCQTIECFRMSMWTRWGNCSERCGGGQMERSRTCEPNVPIGDPNYSNLQFIIRQLQSFSSFSLNIAPYVLSSDTLQIHLDSYRRTCRGETRNSRRCNTQACPTCPNNQRYFKCKPCVRRCQRTNQLPRSLNFDIFRLLEGVEGCNGVCEYGCGCPTLAPYLGLDGRCYVFEILCPINQYFAGNSFQPTRPPLPTHHFTNVPPTTTNAIAPTTTTTASTTTTTTGGVVPRNVEELPTCVYDLIIATTPGHIPCDCDGSLIEIPCQKEEGTSCPVMCIRDEDDQ